MLPSPVSLKPQREENAVCRDSFFLMDDSNSYWWLIRVLKTPEVGYIPAEP